MYKSGTLQLKGLIQDGWITYFGLHADTDLTIEEWTYFCTKFSIQRKTSFFLWLEQFKQMLVWLIFVLGNREQQRGVSYGLTSIHKHASTAVFLWAQAVIKFVLRVASTTLQNRTGEQQALCEFSATSGKVLHLSSTNESAY